MRTTVLVPTLRRSLLALRKASPRAYGWGRTRWRGAPLAAPRTATRGLTVSAETMRRWVPEGGWVWQRATLGAKDDDPPRVARLARSRFVSDQWPRGEALGFADALDIPLWPQVGDTWMPPGRQLQVMTPGAKAKPSLAGALDLATGTWHHTLGPRTTTALFQDWLQAREDASPVAQSQPSDVVVDHDQIHQAKAVEAWGAKPPRRRLLFFPTYGPQTTPLERAFGDAQDLCTRKHTRQRGLDLVADVVEPLHGNGPWRDQRSALYDDPVVTAAVKRLALENTLAAAGEVSQSYVDRFRVER